MSNKLAKDELQYSSSNERATPATKQEKVPSASDDDISVEQLEEIFTRARQTVKPIINREAENEIVDEEILAFKIVRT